MNNSAIRAPIERILPSFAPVFFERGVPGYATEALSPGERRISPEALRPLLVASAFIGAWNHAAERGLDSDKVEELLKRSIPSIADFAPTEAQRAQELVDRFMSFHIIREEHSLDDWLCEALWPAFQSVSYSYPSAMSRIISYALGISDTLQKMVLELGPNNSFKPKPLRGSA